MELEAVATTVATALFTLAGGFLWLRRKLSSDNLAIKRDSGESKLLEIVIRERNQAIEDARRAMEEARAAWEARAQDALQIGTLSAQVESLKELNSTLNQEVHLLRLQVSQLSAELSAVLGSRSAPVVKE